MMYEVENIKLMKEVPGKTLHKFSEEGEEWTLINLEKGFIGGEHYHKGTTKVKNPEVIILLKGSGEFYFRYLKTNQEETITVKAPQIIKVQPNVYHELKATEDCVFLEHYSEEGKKDSFKLE